MEFFAQEVMIRVFGKPDSKPEFEEDGIEPPIFGLWARRDTVSLLRINSRTGEPGFDLYRIATLARTFGLMTATLRIQQSGIHAEATSKRSANALRNQAHRQRSALSA